MFVSIPIIIIKTNKNYLKPNVKGFISLFSELVYFKKEHTNLFDKIPEKNKRVLIGVNITPLASLSNARGVTYLGC